MAQSIQTEKSVKAKRLSPEIAEFLHMLRALETTPAQESILARS